MGPKDIKKDVYKVMTSSRELTNYCTESVRALESKKISYSLNNFHLKNAKQFIMNSLIQEDPMTSKSNDIDFDDPQRSKNQSIYNKVIDYINNSLNSEEI